MGGLAFTREELAQAAADSRSVREMARRLGAGDDRMIRSALRRAVADLGIPVAHFAHSRVALPEAAFTDAASGAKSFTDVIRHLGLPVTEVNRRRVRRRAAELGLKTGHFTRQHVPLAIPRTRRTASPFAVLPPDAPRVSRERLHRALAESGVPCRCADCGNTGTWRELPLTLHIDHVNGDWHDNRRENLRYLCPNCHAQTPTWCRGRRRAATTATGN